MKIFALTQIHSFAYFCCFGGSFVCVASTRAIDSCITFKHQIANPKIAMRYDTEFATLRNTSQNTRIITQKLLRLIAR